MGKKWYRQSIPLDTQKLLYKKMNGKVERDVLGTYCLFFRVVEGDGLGGWVLGLAQFEVQGGDEVVGGGLDGLAEATHLFFHGRFYFAEDILEGLCAR